MLIHKFSLKLIIISIVILFQIFLSYSPLYAAGNLSVLSVGEIHRIANHQRSISGFNELRLDSRLCNAAELKAEHMFKNNYWSHESPNGDTPWSFINDSKYYFIKAGENLAKDFDNSESVISAWMNSPLHKDNLLDADYTDVGYAVVKGVLLGEYINLIVAMYANEDKALQYGLSDTDLTSTTTSPVLDFNNNQVDTKQNIIKDSINSITESNLVSQFYSKIWQFFLGISSKNSLTIFKTFI